MYLHGMPYVIAPDTQKHVPAIMWFGSSYDSLDVNVLRANSDKQYSQDNVFHTILGLLEIRSEEHNPDEDILTQALQPESA